MCTASQTDHDADTRESRRNKNQFPNKNNFHTDKKWKNPRQQRAANVICFIISTQHALQALSGSLQF